MWTFYQFSVQQQQRIEQQQQEDLLRRQELIITSIDGLNNPDMRNTAAYALAILSKETAQQIIEILPSIRTLTANEIDCIQTAIKNKIN